MSFVAKTKSSAEWKLITNVVSTIVEEPSFEANAEGIQFRGMDFIDYPIENKYHDLIVSTSCEHFQRSHLLNFIKRTPEGITFCLQSNNYFGIDGHINCSSSLEEFVEYLPFKSYWAGELSLEKYNRFMVIGTK